CAAAANNAMPPIRCSTARILSVAKNRSATMPTKNGEIMAATAVVPAASPICSPVKCSVWPSHVPIVTYQAPPTKYCRNIIVDSFNRVPVCIFCRTLPASWLPCPACDGRDKCVQAFRRKLDRPALLRAEIARHQELHHFKAIVEGQQRFLILKKCA